MHVSVGTHSVAGTHTSMNQDACFATSADGLACGGVFDGHSEHGELAAAAARSSLEVSSSRAAAWQAANPLEEMARTFQDLQAAALRCHEGVKCRGPNDFGCTAVVGVLDTKARHIILGNVGDSPAYLCAADSSDDLQLFTLSERHHAASEAEQRRVAEECGPSAAFRDGYLVAACGPLQGHGLQPTRSLGHPILSKHGVSSEPHLGVFSLDRGEHQGTPLGSRAPLGPGL